MDHTTVHVTARPRQTAESYNYHVGLHPTQSTAAAAAEIVPILCETLRPRAVVDFGCGLGDWLRAFSDRGVEDVYGLDGNWVPVEKLAIPRERFQVVNFTSEIRLNRRFDLALCLEVAEHFGDEYADKLVDALTRCADSICFSAAVPGQGGYGHVNEQFQDYWVAKFKSRGYRPVDLVRPKIWNNPRVSFWYRQNLLLFLKDSELQRTGLHETPAIISCVHPDLYNSRRDPRNQSLKTVLKLLPFYLLRAFKARVRIG
ncbi:MAG: methyltransferase domain-containing protein [Deltaproteobacteria bacterium]